MVGLGFSKDQEVSIKDFITALLTKVNTNCFTLFFNWLDANSAYLVSNGIKLRINGGVLLGHTTPLTGVWKSCTLFWMSNTGVTARISATISGLEDVVSGKISLIKSIDETFPEGFIYMSVNSTSPATLFGGYWVRLKDRFLLGAGDTYSAGTTGGEATHTLTEAQMPKHKHSIYNSYNNSNAVAVKTSSRGGSSVNDNATGYIIGNYTLSLEEKGGGLSHNNMPPYTVVYMWKRVEEAEAATLSIT